MPRRLLCSIAVVVALLSSPPAGATIDVPHRPNCTIPRSIVVCPKADVLSEFVIRAFNGTTMVNVVVDLDFACAGRPNCPIPAGGQYRFRDPTRARIIGITNALGRVDFRIAAGGVCADSGIVVRTESFAFCRLSLASTDQNNDGTVDGVDVAAIESRLGTNDPTADLDRDGSVTAADVAFVELHLGHRCDLATSAAPRTWGRIKWLYR